MLSLLSSGALSLNLLPGDSSGSSSGTAYAKSYGVIVGSDGIEYSHSSGGSYSGVVGFETWRSDLGHGFVLESNAPADVLAIWRQQQAGGTVPLEPKPTSTSPTAGAVETQPAGETQPRPWGDVDTAGPTIDVLNVDRASTPAGSSPASSSGGPSVNTLPANGGMLTPQPATTPAQINWRYVIGASLLLAGLFWFFGGRRRKGG